MSRLVLRSVYRLRWRIRALAGKAAGRLAVQTTRATSHRPDPIRLAAPFQYFPMPAKAVRPATVNNPFSIRVHQLARIPLSTPPHLPPLDRPHPVQVPRPTSVAPDFRRRPIPEAVESDKWAASDLLDLVVCRSKEGHPIMDPADLEVQLVRLDHRLPVVHRLSDDLVVLDRLDSEDHILRRPAVDPVGLVDHSLECHLDHLSGMDLEVIPVRWDRWDLEGI